MAARRDGYGFLLAGGVLLGMGLLAAAADEKELAEKRRREFEARLGEAISALGIAALSSATLGRGRSNEPFWDVTVLTNGGELLTLRVLLEVGADPFAVDAASVIAQRVRERMILRSSTRVG